MTQPISYASPGRVQGLGKTLLLAGLGIANAALLLSLLTSSPTPAHAKQDKMPIDLSGIDLSIFDPASPALAAQNQNRARPSEYLMIPARLSGINQDIVYIIDTQNGNLTAAAYDAQEGIQFIAPLQLRTVFDRFNQ